MSDLITEAEIADKFGIDPEKAAELRRNHNWPHVRLGRFNIRYTPEQVATIIGLESVKPKASAPTGLAGQTSRSSRRAS